MFLDLEIYMAGIDGEFSDSEKKIIDAHCIEMRIDCNDYQPELPQDELFGMLKSGLSDREKHIVFLELVATILADEKYHQEEEKLVNKLSDLLGINQEEVDCAFLIISDMKKVYERCAEYIK